MIVHFQRLQKPRIVLLFLLMFSIPSLAPLKYINTQGRSVFTLNTIKMPEADETAAV